ncbi:MAG: hypothetical protein QHI38_01240 [Armatimonadota bacterium]|nr:hypothetical protein [Armatimonadota bacterium]
MSKQSRASDGARQREESSKLLPAGSAIVQPSTTESSEAAVPRSVVPEESTKTLPGSQPAQSHADFAEVQADFTRTTFDDQGSPLSTSAEGNVRLRYRDITVSCDKAVVDWKAQRSECEGHVVFRIENQEVKGGKLQLNLRTREWHAEALSTTITPETAKGFLKESLFAESKSVQGIGTRQLSLFDAQATTCSLPTPHYELVSRSVTVYAGDKVVLRDVTMYALGRRLLALPRLTIPLREIQRNPNIIPQIGQTQEEGFFLKTSYSYLATRTMSGLLLFDLMSRKGFGKGLQNGWRYGTASGSLFLYHVFDRTIDQNTITGRFAHSQTFGATRISLSSDFRSNSYLYAPKSTSLVNQLSVSRDHGSAATSLLVSHNIDDAFVRTSRFTATLSHKQLIGDGTLDTSIDYTAYTYDRTRARLTSQAAFEGKEKRFDWGLSVQRLTDLSDEAFIGQGVFGGIEKLHELALVTDGTRLGTGLPLSLKLTYGQYSELPSPISLGRAYFEATTPVQKYALSNTWSLSTEIGFRQYVYTDSTAQYSVAASADISKRLGPTSSLDFVYRRQQASGFAPFRFDYVPRYNMANLSINYQDSKTLRFNILAGYNFEQPDNPWQDLTLRVSVQPSPSLLLYTATGYDLNRSQWRTLVNQLRVRAGSAGVEDDETCPFRLDIGTRYDTASRRLATARAVLDARIRRLWRIQANAGYNGFTKSFDYKSIVLTRDLHCWEASIAYVDQGGFYRSRGITFTIRIKAFPLFQNFGVGSFGQTLDTSVGDVY